MNLDYYGSACRCLLRLREDLGNPIISDQLFIASHLEMFPEWEQRPGAVGLERLLDLAVELGISSSGVAETDYDRVLAEHRAGNAILIRTRQTGRNSGEVESDLHYSVLLEMDKNQLKRWAPTRDGFSDTVTNARVDFWDRELATAVVFAPVRVMHNVSLR